MSKNVSWQDELNTEVKSLNQPNSLIGKVARLTVDLVCFYKLVAFNATAFDKFFPLG